MNKTIYMKKTFCILLVFLQVGALSAQSLKFEAHAGGNLSRLTGGDKYRVYDSKNMPGEQIGGNVYYTFKKGITLSSGIDLIQTGGKYAAYSEFYNAKTPGSPLTEFKEIKNRELSLEIPLRAGYLFHLSKNIDLFPFIGCYARYSVASMNSSLTLADSPQSINWNCHKDYTNGSYALTGYDKFDFGYDIGVSLIVHQHYIFGLEYSKGLRKRSNQFNVKNSDIRFIIGYIF